jgi:hypothetical protein
MYSGHPVSAEGASDASERATAELRRPGASQASGGCKQQSSRHPAGSRAAGIGHKQPHELLTTLSGRTIAAYGS